MGTNNEPISCLDETCYEAIGKTLFVRTVYGWGWMGTPDEPNEPKSFEFTLKSLWKKENGLLDGGIGTITEIEHHYNGWHIIFMTRHLGRFNFTDKIGYFNIFITKEFRFRDEDGQPIPVKNEGGCSGFAEIGYREYIYKKVQKDSAELEAKGIRYAGQIKPFSSHSNMKEKYNLFEAIRDKLKKLKIIR